MCKYFFLHVMKIENIVMFSFLTKIIAKHDFSMIRFELYLYTVSIIEVKKYVEHISNLHNKPC